MLVTKKPFIFIYIFVFQLYVVCPLYAQGNVLSKEIAGWVECASIEKVGIELIAKLDSGADNSSLNVKEFVKFKRNGTTFVRFNIDNFKGQIRQIEAEVIRIAKVKRHKSVSDHRPVIILDICIDNRCKKTEVNLADRTKYVYQLLLGRSFLKDDFLIDPSKMFILTPNCR